MSTFLSSALTQPTPQPTRLGRRLFGWLKRGLLGLLISLVALTGVGAIYQAVATAYDLRTLLPPGQLVDVGGYKLHIYCTGPTTPDSPTVILEPGLGATASAWAWIQPAVAKTARVCAYDRAGMGWSEPSAEPHDAQHIAKALHTLLHNANIGRPYVLVGWSYGGLYMRAYADQYRTEVAGVVLLDSSSPDQCTSTPGGQAQCASFARIYAIAPALARIGVMRVMGHFQPASGLPAPQSAQLAASFSATKDWDAQSAEFLASPATNVQVRAAAFPVGVPLFVLTATEHGTPADLEQYWQSWQHEMATLSTNGMQRIVAGASHTSLVFKAKDAKASAAAIFQVLAAVRTGKPLASQ